MMTLPERTSLAPRLVWALRLSVATARRNPGLTVLVIATFALATLSAVGCGLFAASWRGQVARDADAGAPSGSSVELVAFLRDDLPRASRDALAGALGGLAGVAGVRVLGSDEALARMRAELGARASVLDGVEEGFLPATLEVSLRPGVEGAGRADAIAWRLRRMDGVSDVDVLRATADERVARARRLGRAVGGAGVAAAGAAALLALVLAAFAMRRRRANAQILIGLGFTPGAIAAPASIASAASATLGALLAIGCTLVTSKLVTDSRLAGLAREVVGGHARWALSALIVCAASLLGAGLGWWGACPPRRSWEAVGAGD
jgi:cell division protein FtsX